MGYGHRVCNTKIYESYYEGELAVELGSSMETAMWGSATVPMIDDLEDHSCPHVVLPNLHWTYFSNGIHLQNLLTVASISSVSGLKTSPNQHALWPARHRQGTQCRRFTT